MNSVNGEFWNKFKSRIQAHWKQLSDEDIEMCRNNFDSLSIKIQNKCRESRSSAQNYIDNLWFEIYVRGGKETYRAHSLNQAFDANSASSRNTALPE